MSIGEAAGAAAALSVKCGVSPRQLDIKILQKALMNNGAQLFTDEEEEKISP